MVAVVPSSLSSVSALAPLAAGGRTPRAVQIAPEVDAAVAPGGVGIDPGGARNNSADILPGPVAGLFAVQAFAQEGAGASPPGARPAQQASAAYRLAASQVEGDEAGDIQVPGQQPLLSSGRMIDLTA